VNVREFDRVDRVIVKTNGARRRKLTWESPTQGKETENVQFNLPMCGDHDVHPAGHGRRQAN